MVQTEGGYHYPGGIICVSLSIGAILISTLIWFARCLVISQGLALLFGLEGTVLIASAYTPVGLVPPNGTAVARIIWFFKPQKGIQVSFNQPMFFGGLFSLFLSYVFSAFVG